MNNKIRLPRVLFSSMKIWPDCIPCILKMSLGAARVVMKDEVQVGKFTDQVWKSKYFNGEDKNVTSPEIIREVWLKMIEFSGETDPLREVKDDQNRKALAVYPKAKELVLESGDPLLGAIKLAAAANSIDAMADVKGGKPEEIVQRWSGLQIEGEHFRCLKRRLEKARRVVFLGDNCGEIVFDRLLMEVLLEKYPLEIAYITRTVPVMNDATLKDAYSVGIGEIAQALENGVHEPFPGTFLKGINSESRQLIEQSDLVKSKGGGNYDSLTEEEKLKGRISFLFLAKCHPYCYLHRVSLNAPIIYNS